MSTVPSARPFNRRAFAASMAALAGATLPISGWFCHVYQFEPMTTGRHAWMAVHVATAILFVAFAGWHALMNRKAIAAYMRSATAGGPGFSRETRLAAAIFALVLFVAAGHAFLAPSARALAVVALW